MAGPTAANTEWFFGAKHDDVLDATLKAREREKRRLEASLLAGRGKAADKDAKATKGKVPVTDLVKVLKEHIQRYYDDIFDAFGEIDMNSNGRASKLEFREGIRAMSGDPALHKDQLHPSNFTNEQLEDVFEFMDSKSENVLRFEQFVTHFGADKRKKPGRDGKSDAAKDLQRTRARSFQEVHMECKDERGIEKNLQVPATITFEDLLEKLKSAFGRAVTIMYEDSAKHKHTVINAQDLSKCWNALATSGEGREGTVHFECMVVDFDPSTTAKKASGGRPSLAERRKNAAKVRGDRGEMQGDRDPVENLDFRSRHKWIDDMMRLLGAPLENEPAAMQNKWDALIIECRQLDISGQSIVTVEAFRNALTRTEPRMTAEHVEWFVQDADKDSQGNVLYEAYASTKKQGQSAGSTLKGTSDQLQREVKQARDKIEQALRNNFKSLQQAFKRMDVDRDGRLSRDEFRKGVEQRLKLRLPSRLLEEVIRIADKGRDGFIDYEDFLEMFSKADRKDVAGKDDGLTDEEITQIIMSAKLNIAQIFRDMDDNGDGVLSPEELAKGLSDMKLNLGKQRVLKFMASMDIDATRTIDYREFLRKLSTVNLRDVSREGRDDFDVDRIRSKLREQYDDAKHAFHAWDLDADGRLSFEEFMGGVQKLDIEDLKVDPDDDGGEAGAAKRLKKVFDSVNSTGDGFIAYHEFLFRFPIRPKQLETNSGFDQEFRIQLQKKFSNVTEAFTELDMNGDNRLSKDDILEGLQRNHIWSGKFDTIEDKTRLEQEVAGLVQRCSTTGDKQIDYYDFVVRFGLNSKVEGKWVYVPPTKKDPDQAFGELANEWRKLMNPSKWRGRGGVRATMERFNEGGGSDMKQRQFLEALRDGLLMKDIEKPFEEKLIKGKPWTTMPKDGAKDKDGSNEEPKINIAKFFQLFLDVYFENDKILYDVLLVQNRWLDLRLAFNACSSVVPDKDDAGIMGDDVERAEVKLISKSDFGNALQTLVDKGKLTEKDRQVIIAISESEKRFVEKGRYVGYIDYENDFFGYFIPDEIEIYNKVFKYWEDCDARFEKLGSSLTYTEFEILCREVVGKRDEQDALKSEQISFLIDVIDINGDGTVGRSEFLERYAREDATIQMSLRSSWYHIMQLFHAEKKKGIKSKQHEYNLTQDQFQKALTKSLEQNLLGSGGKMTPEQITEIVSNLDPKLKDKSGAIKYDDWLRKYVPDQYEIHFAMTGDDTTTNMPKWDALIASFETLDKCTMANKSLEADHMLSWDHFRKALRMADIGLDDEKVQKIIDKLDKEMTGSVCWTDMVNGSTAPYFFDGKQDYEMRMLLCNGWPALYDKCKQHEISVRKKEPGLLPQIPQSAAGSNKIMTLGTLTPQQFQECLKDCPVLNLRDQNGKELPLVKKIVDVCNKAFLEKTLLDRNGKSVIVIDYDAVCRHYAGASFDAERDFERKWEAVIEVLQELKEQHAGKQLARDAFRNRLSSSDLHVSDATIDFLLRDQHASLVDIDVICWKTAKGTILKILEKKWSLLLSLCRAKDTKNRRRLDLPTLQAILNRADVGMSSSLVEILLQNLEIEDDGKIDYDKLLSGKLKTGTYPIDVYTAYKCMESEWETLSRHFWEYDLNGDGRVNHEEFRQALRSLQHLALSDMNVIADLIQQLDPNGDPNANPPTDNIDFDKFSWAMARSELVQVVETRGREMLDAFRKEATREFQEHKGKLPAPKAMEAFNTALKDTGVKPVLIKILVSRAQSTVNQKSGEFAGGEPVKMIEETQLMKAFREIVGDSFEKAEQTFIRDNFARMLAESNLSVMDTWRLYGEQHSSLKKFAGAASLGADALRHVGPAPLKRVHMHGFLGHGGRFMLESMAASPALVDIKEDRVKTIYSGNPWISFWKVRANYRSSAITMSQTSAAPNSRGHSQPAAHSILRPAPTASIASSSVSTHPKESDSKAGPENVWEKVRQKVRLAAFHKFHTNQEALNALDPENPGAGAIASAALRQALEALVPDLNSAELELIAEKLDPGRDGMVLKSDIAYMLLPPAADRSSLERLAQERHARGIYARLRGRQATLSSSPGTSVPPHTSRARPGESGPSLLQQRLGAQVTGGVSVSGHDAGYRYAYNWNRVEHPPGAVRPSYFPSQRGGVQSGQGTRPGSYVGDSSDPWTGQDPWPRHESANVFPSSSGYSPLNAASGQYHGDARRGVYSERPIEQYRPTATTGLMATEPRYSMTQIPAQDYGPVRDVDELQDLYRSTMEQLSQLQDRH